MQADSWDPNASASNSDSSKDPTSATQEPSGDNVFGMENGSSEDAQSSPSSVVSAEQGSVSTVKKPAAASENTASKEDSPVFNTPTAKSKLAQEPASADDSSTKHKAAALAYIRTGDVPSALAEVRSGLESDPNDESLQGLEKLLAKRLDGSQDFSKVAAGAKQWLDQDIEEGGDSRSDSQRPPQPAEVSYASPIAWGLPSAAQAAAPSLAARKETQSWVSRMNMGDFSGAERFFSQKLEQNPNDLNSLRYRALSRRNLNDPVGALADMDRAVRIEPENSVLRSARAMTLMDLNRPQEALQEAQKAVDLNPRSGAAYRTRALANEKLGKTDEMLADLKAAAELDSQFESAYNQALRGYGKPAAFSFPKIDKQWLWGLGLLAFLIMLWRILGSHISRTVRRPAPGGILPPAGFHIVRRIGEGGMGEVFEAIDIALGRKVAIKKMRPEIAADAHERKRFIREARTVAGLRHSNIVEIHSVQDDAEGVFLVFELVEGRTLYDQILEKGKMSLDQALRVIRPVADALDYAHKKGVMHRDLKPSNIMLSADGVKVMDFGIARRAQDSVSTLSRGEIAGTPAYMSPEQEVGEPCPASDIYALAACLYEVMAGEAAFRGASLTQKTERNYVPLSKMTTLPPAADQVLYKALDPRPENRYQCAIEFISAFTAAACESAPAVH
ncbi:MAG: protein kinase [Elusimicrobiota bacterium]